MGARRCRIFLWVFNSIYHEQTQRTIETSSWTREEKGELNKLPLAKPNIPAHIEKLRIYMNTTSIDILVINERRLDHTLSSGEVTVPDYAFEWNNRKRNRVGVAINYERLFDLDLKSLEWIGIKVIKLKAKPFIVSTNRIAGAR